MGTFPVRINALGRFTVFVDGQDRTENFVRKSDLVLGYLLLTKGDRSRKEIAESVWQEPFDSVEISKALDCLRQTVAAIRKATRPHSVFTDTKRGLLRLDPSTCESDVWEFDEISRNVRHAPVYSLEKMIQLYQGHLFSNLNANWIVYERQSREATYLVAVNRLVESYVLQSRTKDVEHLLRKALNHCPRNEAIFKRLADLLVQSGEFLELRSLMTSHNELLKRTYRQGFSNSTREYLKTLISEPPEVLVSIPTRAPVVVARSPVPPTKTIGRDKDLINIDTCLESSQALVISGIGGIGKTRLAIEYGSGYETRYRDGVYFVSLTGINTLEDACSQILTALRPIDFGEGNALERITRSIGDRNLLLILDNCEEVVDSCSKIVLGLVSSCRNCRILATSVLNIPGIGISHLILEPLDCVSPLDSKDQILKSSSVQLFIDSAKRAKPSFLYEDDIACPVAQICERLGGIPLGIELVASRVNSLTVFELELRLSDVFREWAISAVSNNEHRHKNLSCAIEWTLSFLNKSHRRFVENMSIFKGGWSLDMARLFGDISTESSLWDALEILIGCSIIRVAESNGLSRYSMVEPIRIHLWDRLTMDRKEELGDRAWTYLLRLSETLRDCTFNDSQLGQLAEHDCHYENYIWALSHSINTDKAEQGIRLFINMARLWELNSRKEAGIYWINQLLQHADLEPEVLTDALTCLAGLQWNLGEIAIAKDSYQRAAVIASEICDADREVECLAGVAMSYWAQGDYERAIAITKSCIEKKMTTNPRVLGRLYSLHANTLYRQGFHDEAEMFQLQSLELRKQVGDLQDVAMTQLNLGDLYRDKGDFESAQRALAEALRLGRMVQDIQFLGYTLAAYGYIEVELGRTELAEPYLREAKYLSTRAGDMLLTSLVEHNFARLMMKRGEYLIVLRHSLSALTGRVVANSRRGIAESLEMVAIASSQLQRSENALLAGFLAQRLRKLIGSPVPKRELEALSLALDSAAQQVHAQFQEQIRLRAESNELECILTEAMTTFSSGYE